MQRKNLCLWFAVTLVALTLALPLVARPQQEPSSQPSKEQAPPSKKEQAPSPEHRLTIEVTGGDSNKPIEEASVYLKTIEERLIKDKKFEVNVKTNEKGITHVPDAPMGKVLVQVVADGYKPYGHWFEITDPKQVIKIHLERPPKWY